MKNTARGVANKFIHPSVTGSVIGYVLLTSSVAMADADSLTEIQKFFSRATVSSGPELVDCKLTDGSETACFSITVKADPQSYTPGPWCPDNVSDGVEQGGIWIRDGQTHDVDGAFISNIAEFYGDDRWQLFDPDTGVVRVTRTEEACRAAARPDVDPQYQNHCVQCLPEYMPDDATTTYVIPLQPMRTNRQLKTGRSGSGVAFNGVRLDGPAPIDHILGAYTIAPFDDCGGHVNMHVGYHYHAVTDCLDGDSTESGSINNGATMAHGVQVGIAMDGFGIFSNRMADGTVAENLDACNGHDVDGVGYHYHAGEPGSNAIVGCLNGEAGCTLNDATQSCDASMRRRRP